MNPREFCAQTRVAIVAGKGGVGKTTVSGALARMAAGEGLSTLVVEIEGKHGLAAAFGVSGLAYDDQELMPGVRARTLTPDEALLEYLDEHGLTRISKRLTRTGTIDVVATAAPGIKDILLLGKVKQLEQRKEFDLILLDAPAAGHAVTFLLSARTLLDTVSMGPIRQQAEDVLAMLTDPSRCRVLLVTLPEETPVNEVVETAFTLEDKVGVDLGPVVVNGLYPRLDGLDVDPEAAAAEADVGLRPGEADALRAAARFRAGRQQLQDEQVARLAEALPLPQLHVPALFTAEVRRDEIDALAGSLAASVRSL
ncbi:MAG: ArsA family ATPase [Acidimicrobiales bacterium]